MNFPAKSFKHTPSLVPNTLHARPSTPTPPITAPPRPPPMLKREIYTGNHPGRPRAPASRPTKPIARPLPPHPDIVPSRQQTKKESSHKVKHH